MSQDLTDKSTLVQVMAWCCQATSHYLSQCWFSSLSPCSLWLGHNELNCLSFRCSWSIACLCHSNYIFIHDLIPGFNGFGKDICKTRRETFKFFGFGVSYIRYLTVGCLSRIKNHYIAQNLARDCTLCAVFQLELKHEFDNKIFKNFQVLLETCLSQIVALVTVC